MKFFFNRKMIIVVVSASVLYAAHFYWSNTGIEGVYQCDSLSPGSEERSFFILYEGNMYFAVFSGSSIINARQISNYYEDEGKYFVDNSRLSDIVTDNEISADFSGLTWSYYDKLLDEGGFEKKRNDLFRVLNPFLKSKILRVLREGYTENDEGSILGLW